MPIALPLPRPTIAELATRVTELCNAHLAAASRPTVAVVDLSAVPLIARDLAEPPPDCPVRLLAADGSRTFIVERWSRFASFLRAITTIGAILIGMLATTIGCLGLRPDRAIPLLWHVALADTCLIWLCVAFLALRTQWRRAVITATPEGLAVVCQGPAGRHERHWPRNQIAAVRTAQQPMRDFHVHSQEYAVGLVLVLISGKQLGILGGEEERTWRWVATELRAILGVSHGYATSPADAATPRPSLLPRPLPPDSISR